MTKATHIIDRDQNCSQLNRDVRETVLFDKRKGGFREVEMGIASDGMDFVLEMLSDLSVNRGAYAIREAWSNAYDATVATGDMTRRIDIIVPEPWQVGRDENTNYADGIAAALRGKADVETTHVARIIDNGIGMTEDDVERYFTQYGGSKKRDDKDQVGARGLGSKAGLACSDTICVKTVHPDGNGVQIETCAIIERRDGKNTATITTNPTDKGCGTEIIIPVVSYEIASQMKECAEEIARYNLDANLYVNGEKATSFLEQGREYIYLGEVEIGQSSDGTPVSFRMWQSETSFMTRDSSTIDLNLAGVRYSLTRRGYYGGGVADLIVAGDPGYLNFTPSRDEVKEDGAKTRFVAAVRDALNHYDFTAAVNAKLASLSCYEELMDWIWRQHSARIEEIKPGRYAGLPSDADGLWMIRWNDPICPVEDASLVKDGIDFSPLFADDTSPFAGFTAAETQQRFRHWARSRSYNNSKISYAEVQKAKFAAEKGRVDDETHTNELIAAVRPNTLKNAIVITDMGEDADLKQFTLYEKNIRDAYDRDASAFYLLVPGAWNPSDIESAVFSDATVVDIDTAIAEAKKARNALRGTNAKGEKVVSWVLGDTYSLDHDADEILFYDRCYSAGHHKVNFGLPEEASRYGIVAGPVERISGLVTALSMANAENRLPFSKLFVCDNSRIANADLDGMIANGATLVLDCRISVKTNKESGLGEIEGLEMKVVKTTTWDDKVRFTVKATADIAKFPSLVDDKLRNSLVVSHLVNTGGLDTRALSTIARIVRGSDAEGFDAAGFATATEIMSARAIESHVAIIDNSDETAEIAAKVSAYNDVACKVFYGNGLDTMLNAYTHQFSDDAVAFIRPAVEAAVAECFAEAEKAEDAGKNAAADDAKAA